ncbi:MAG: hypothetical protein CVV02_09385 [Firmicutes bacterium HGW-Firmicutes-7]|nr:MAG: hypothetical protein CVV02_09385 [Firmicutes bacterium HGW-Firmicutes-7]
MYCRIIEVLCGLLIICQLNFIYSGYESIGLNENVGIGLIKSVEIAKIIGIENVGGVINVIEESNKKVEKSYEIIQQQNIKEVYEILMETQNFYVIPEGSILNKVVVLEDEVFLDFSKELLNYGGNRWEEELVKILLDTAFSFENINYVTVAIDGEIKNLVEGTIINRYTRENWMKGNDDNE